MSVSFDKTIKIWDLDSFEVTNTLIGHENRAYSVNYKNQEVISTGEDQSIIIWDTKTSKPKHIINGHQDEGMIYEINIKQFI